MATHSSTLAWKIPWMEEPGRLQSMGSQRVTSSHFSGVCLGLTQLDRALGGQVVFISIPSPPFSAGLGVPFGLTSRAD